MAEELIEVFEHINFFNLLESDSSLAEFENKDAIEALFWQIEDEKQAQAYAAQGSYGSSQLKNVIP